MLSVVVIGAGLGGLACAIACRRYGLEVIVLEQASNITPVGAGIQAPPNASRVLKWLGLLERVKEYGCVLDHRDLLSYKDGTHILRMSAGQSIEQEYGAPWLVIHRADYHQVLLEAAMNSGVQVRLGASVKSIDFEKTAAVVDGGEVISGDVIVGADGLWSTTRDQILGHPSPPCETGDLAYRATLNTADMLALNDYQVTKLCAQRASSLWMGPNKHCVLYPLKGGSVFNLVLIRPDNLPPGTNKIQGEIEEMRETFKGWDASLTKIISLVPNVLKWKLSFHEALDTWCKGNVTVLGDACHPTLPYQAQGAAMAIEDGAVLGYLLGSLVEDFEQTPESTHEQVPSLLQLYEKLRKLRTATNVKGAEANRYMFHLEDGDEQQRRDEELKSHDSVRPSRWNWADPTARDELYGHDIIAECEREYNAWKSSSTYK